MPNKRTGRATENKPVSKQNGMCLESSQLAGLSICWINHSALTERPDDPTSTQMRYLPSYLSLGGPGWS